MAAVLVARRPMCCGIEMASEVPASQAARHGWCPPRNNCAPLGCLRFPGKPCHQHHAPGGFRNNCAPHLQLPRILPPVGSPFLSTHSRLVQHLHGHDLGRIHFFLHNVKHLHGKNHAESGKRLAEIRQRSAKWMLDIQAKIWQMEFRRPDPSGWLPNSLRIQEGNLRAWPR